MFAPQSEIWDYMHRVSTKYGIDRHVRYNSQVESLEWDDEGRYWNVRVEGGDHYTPRAVISGPGGLHVPSYPELPGLESFQGTAFHSADWDHSYDLRGKRVAVIGTGASAIQFVPAIAGRVGSLTVFQRTAPWVQRRPDFRIPEPARQVLKRVPGTARAFRAGLYWALEARGAGFVMHPALARPLEASARRQIERQISDPRLRAKVTPDYRFGCKRGLLSNDYYPALCRDNVELVTSGIAEVREHSIITNDGVEHPMDAIIFGTGFKVSESLTGRQVVGRNGLKIQEAWADGVEAHYGVTVPGFPNYFMLVGPNTGLGHNSIVFMIEAQTRYVLGCLRMLAQHRATTIEVKASAMRRVNERVQRRLGKRVWNDGGCVSWYLDEAGVNRTLWPGFSFEYWLEARPRLADYDIGR
jgi:cation diffusion facilitator CzcD-associated flavoprotein CzcO